ncbi:MAG: 4Fe-4S dicluster domain-containing protein [Anaerolineae bacterium]|nr:4Fe-4S dicluster domain-containing protein [Anaerolineae bacterium]
MTKDTNMGLPTAPVHRTKFRRTATIDVDHGLCTGCRLCEIACSLEHEGMVHCAAARVQVHQFYPGPLDIPILCQRCFDPPCMAACPPKQQAMTWDEEREILVVDQEKCLGQKCALCAKACPHGAITFHPSRGTALVCDLCGGQPRCATVCPVDCLSFVPGTRFDPWHVARLSAQEIAAGLASKYRPYATRNMENVQIARSGSE